MTLLVIALTSLAASTVHAKTATRPLLKDRFDSWLQEVDPLITPAERTAFLALADPGDREVFIRRFWEARRPDQDSSSNPLLGRWHQSSVAAEQLFPDLFSDRRRALAIAGKPEKVTSFEGCSSVVRPLEIWWFSPWHAAYQSGGRYEQGFSLLFYRELAMDVGSYRWWSPDDGATDLLYGGSDSTWSTAELLAYGRDEECWKRTLKAVERLEKVLAEALDENALIQALLPPPPDPAWLGALADELAQDVTVADLADVSLRMRFMGRYQQRTILEGVFEVPHTSLRRNGEGQLFDRLVITGDIWRGRRLVDTFRIVHHIAGAPPTARVPIDFYRRLRPGSYALDIRLEGARGLPLLRQSQPLEVPRMSDEAAVPAGRRHGFAGLTRSEVGMLTTFPSIELLMPSEELLVGSVELEAATSGGPIETVDFFLDDALAASDVEPPYAAILELGELPERHTATAVARDPAGRELARHTLQLNTAGKPFRVRLLAPRLGGSLSAAEVQLDVPEAETLDRLEIYVNERRVATLREPPFVAPLGLDRSSLREMTYVRAVAMLESSAVDEDLVLVYSPNPMAEVDVQWVELYTSVLDGRGKPIPDLLESDFQVFENDRPQEILRFARVESLPIHVALLMDVSGSMRGRVRTAAVSAERFFATVLTDKDTASLLTFHHDIQLVVPFTRDVAELRYGATGARAWGTTRLNDSLIYTIHAFGGLRDKRALVLLSDGRDVHSDYPFRQVLEHALRSRVAIYPIALDLPDAETQGQLEQLADETGGRYFAITSVHELDQIYRQIEEDLRSQYLLVYRPPSDGDRGFRAIRVQANRKGAKARTLRGYYP